MFRHRPPTFSPTIELYELTNEPTNEPTTLQPTLLPSYKPTKLPSNKPSYLPSYFPSTLPSYIPSYSPSNKPSILPSYSPSYSPTYFPSEYPTESPSFIPTNKIHSKSEISNYQQNNIKSNLSLILSIPLCILGVIVVIWLSILFKRRKKIYVESSKPLEGSSFNKLLVPTNRSRIYMIRNHFLPTGNCCICQSENLKVYILKPCNHSICVDDIRNYLFNATKDSSLFPLKCPMHYQGCTSILEPILAKRFLSFNFYLKYLEFHDRSIYGPGIHCIYCMKYIPSSFEYSNKNRIDMIACLNCKKIFCTQCKQSNHHKTNGKCPVENEYLEEKLFEWKSKSNAQICPGCNKLIEKEDSQTCNHMCHKITDSIPCIKQRTDFCYCCGMEVMPSYPHYEVSNMSENHFPNGVYQNCRTILLKEQNEKTNKVINHLNISTEYEREEDDYVDQHNQQQSQHEDDYDHDYDEERVNNSLPITNTFSDTFSNHLRTNISITTNNYLNYVGNHDLNNNNNNDNNNSNNNTTIKADEEGIGGYERSPERRRRVRRNQSHSFQSSHRSRSAIRVKQFNLGEN